MVRSKVAETEVGLNRTKAEREKTFDRKKGEVGQINDFIQRVMSVYRMHNVRARSSAVSPKSFKDFPDIKVSATFSRARDWQCPDLASRTDVDRESAASKESTAS